jgi:ABC-type multidrug transport system fused ATPase/permease subunit
MMINEFAGQNFTGLVVTTRDGTADLGTLPGSLWLTLTGLPRRDSTSGTGIKVFDVVFSFLLAFVYDYFGCYFVERKRDLHFNQSRRPQRVAESNAFSEAGNVRIGREVALEGGEDSSRTPAGTDADVSPTTLTVKSLSYYVPLPKQRAPLRLTAQSIISTALVRNYGSRLGLSEGQGEVNKSPELALLNEVDAVFRRGRMAASTGASAAGKSTLLDVRACYKTAGRISGEIRIDGRIKDPLIRKRISA